MEWLNALAVRFFEFIISEGRVEIIWTCLVVPGLLLSVACFGLYVVDEIRRRRHEAHRSKRGRPVDEVLKITSYVILINEGSRVIVQIMMVIIAVVALITPPRGGPDTPPTLLTLIVPAFFIFIAFLLDAGSIVAILGRYQIHLASSRRRKPMEQRILYIFHMKPEVVRAILTTIGFAILGYVSDFSLAWLRGDYVSVTDWKPVITGAIFAILQVVSVRLMAMFNKNVLPDQPPIAMTETPHGAIPTPHNTAVEPIVPPTPGTFITPPTEHTPKWRDAAGHVDPGNPLPPPSRPKVD